MPPPARDKVFISYSHRDAVWLDRMLIFLKPFLREGSLSIWNDQYIEVGSLWRREIDSGLQQAAVGLLLVSPHFLASDFIMDEELPALVDAAERNLLDLVWVPVSASNWDHSPLKRYQAGWNPARPLDGLKTPARNRALVQITKKVDETAKPYAAGVPAPSTVPRQQERATPPVVSPREPLGPGDLHDVPHLPPHYLPRADDLDRLRRSLLEHDSAAIGITGEPYRMGLHGQGGIGKSVLAAALARDEQVRLAFPDGVFWLTVGQAPDVPRLQAALLAEAGGESTAATDEQRGRKLLEERFARSAALLVLDDVWDYRHARAFDVLGPASRLLVTTRDSAVLTALGAHPETVHRLPEAAALALLSSWAGAGGDSLPESAKGVARECGYLPLALSLAGARVKDGTPWEVLLKALKRGHLEFLDHPYGSVFGSMRLSVDALPPDDRQRYLELAVFPEDEQVPVTVVLTLWKETAGLDELDGEALLSRLHSKALIELLDTDGRREVALHDLQHDFLRLTVRDLPSLHSKLLAGLAAELPAADRDFKVFCRKHLTDWLVQCPNLNEHAAALPMIFDEAVFSRPTEPLAYYVRGVIVDDRNRALVAHLVHAGLSDTAVTIIDLAVRRATERFRASGVSPWISQLGLPGPENDLRLMISREINMSFDIVSFALGWARLLGSLDPRARPHLLCILDSEDAKALHWVLGWLDVAVGARVLGISGYFEDQAWAIRSDWADIKSELASDDSGLGHSH